ncbi:hypothetical protein F4818DRAFT_121229 [Hypoxylon cercidicola]|nr:hypothetical protein F4818DRAFT_121229 [Hypoxylon cercidicola]
MADNKATTAGEEAKRTEPVADTTTETHSENDEKTEDAPANSDSTSQTRPTRHLPTHYKGMPKQWEKNQVPKKYI